MGRWLMRVLAMMAGPKKRGRSAAFAFAGKERGWAWGLVAAFLALFAADLAFPPPLARGRVISPVVLDKDGTWLRAFATPDQKWRLAARLDEIDPEFLRRVVRVEDKNFWMHPGVDPPALARATLSLAQRRRVVSGGSTITMQTARLLEPRPRTVLSKLIEIVRAVQIERRLSKREILSLYLTLTPYGGNLEGVRAASRAYFGRDPQGLSDAEMALLIALPQAPEARRPDRRPQAARRARDKVLAEFQRRGFISARLAAEGRESPIPGRQAFPIRADLAPQRLVAAHPGQAVIVSTLDARLQTELAAKAREAAIAAGPSVSAALLVVEIKGRRVRASVGGPGFDRAGGYIDMTRAVRSPGSALKPFIYGLAFDDGIAAPDTLIEDAPRRFSGYLPENFDRRFRGELRVREALQYSLNLPAVETLEQIGPARFEAALRNVGADLRLPNRAEAEPGLALALGGVGISLEDLAMLYAGLGDKGEVKPLHYVEAPSFLSRRIVKPATAERVLAILAGSPAPAGRMPARLTAAAPQIAFKTGTSYGFRDAIAMGVGAGHVVAVWVGRPDGAPRPGATGREAALPLLFDAFDRVIARGAPTQRFAPQEENAPKGLERFRARQAETGPQILFPPDNAELYVERFGPEGKGFSLAARGGAGRLRWYAEGVAAPVETTSGRVIWRPSGPGFYTVQAIDAAGRRASVRVRVRGFDEVQ